MQLDLFLELATPPGRGITPAEAIRHAERIAVGAEEAGIDTLWLPEHHFLDGYSNSAAPDMILAAISNVTRKLRLGFAIIPLPLHDPVRIAERLATLDALAPGRVRWGVGRGVTVTELKSFGVDPAESRTIFEERHQELMNILETGEAERGGEKLALRPPPPTDLGRGWLASVSPESFDYAAANNLNVMTGPFKPWPFVQKDLSRYRKLAPWGETSFALSVFCEEDHEKARARAEEGFQWVYRRLFEVARPILQRQVEGYEDYRKLGWTVPLLDKMLSIKTLETLGLAAVGSPEHVAKRLSELEANGLDRVSLVVGGGDLEVEEVCRALNLISHAFAGVRSATNVASSAVTA